MQQARAADVNVMVDGSNTAEVGVGWGGVAADLGEFGEDGREATPGRSRSRRGVLYVPVLSFSRVYRFKLGRKFFR